MSHSLSMGAVAGLGDEATLIRSSPLGAAPMPGSPTDWSNASTSIRPDPTAQVDDPILLPDPDEWGDAETRIRRPPEGVSGPPTRLASAPPPTRVVDPPAPAPARPAAAPAHHGLQQLLYLVLGAVVTVVVLMVGFLLGVRASPIVATPSPGTPMLEVHAPANAKVTINDQPVSGPGPHPVAPGRHIVRVRSAAGNSAEARLELAAGEHRHLTFQTEAAPR
jgi:hypothetical protein